MRRTRRLTLDLDAQALSLQAPLSGGQQRLATAFAELPYGYLTANPTLMVTCQC